MWINWKFLTDRLSNDLIRVAIHNGGTKFPKNILIHGHGATMNWHIGSPVIYYVGTKTMFNVIPIVISSLLTTQSLKAIWRILLEIIKESKEVEQVPSPSPTASALGILTFPSSIVCWFAFILYSWFHTVSPKHCCPPLKENFAASLQC